MRNFPLECHSASFSKEVEAGPPGLLRRVVVPVLTMLGFVI